MSEQSKGFCPVIGGNLVPKEGPVINAGAPQSLASMLDWQLLRCIEDKCAFWNDQKKGCSIKIGADALSSLGDLVEANKGKMSVLSMLGGGKK